MRYAFGMPAVRVRDTSDPYAEKQKKLDERELTPVGYKSRGTADAGMRRSKDWIAIDPDGKEYRFRNLAQFCAAHELSSSLMRNVADGKNASHKGWRCIRVEPPLPTKSYVEPSALMLLANPKLSPIWDQLQAARSKVELLKEQLVRAQQELTVAELEWNKAVGLVI
jgi:hypothetical protein